ncbi:unnamed protein product, partial [Ascophyllum nodosum]
VVGRSCGVNKCRQLEMTYHVVTLDQMDGHQPFGSPEAACWEGPRYEAARDQE